MLCMCSYAANLCVSTRLDMNFSPASPFCLLPPTCMSVGSQPFTFFLLLFDSLLHISSSSYCENKQSSTSNCHSRKRTVSLWHCSCLLSLPSMSSLTTSSHTETYFRTTASCQRPLCPLPTFHPHFNWFYFPSDVAPEELRVRYVSEVNMVRLRGSGQLKAKGIIGLDNPALMWLNEALHYTAHGLMLYIRLL